MQPLRQAPSRRTLIKAIACLPLSTRVAGAIMSASLPEKSQFAFEGTYLNSAFTHPMNLRAFEAGEQHLKLRLHDANRMWPGVNARNAAVKLFASLINADPAEIAVVPSTMEGENLIGAALRLGPEAGVVTDSLHYDASLAMYGEMQEHGIPVAVAEPVNNAIEPKAFDALITKDTRLIAISLVSGTTGFQHDLKALCDMAHARGVMVYADIIQAAGAVPIDVKASGVDFSCCGTYKFLMGDFGAALLYVRPDRLANLVRVQYGWRQLDSDVQHRAPGDPPEPPLGKWQVGADTASRFEVSTPNWCGLAIVAASMQYIQSLGVEQIQRYRQPMLQRLHKELPAMGFSAMTPASCTSPVVCFAMRDAARRLGPSLEKNKVKISLYDNYIRVSLSVFNDMEDIERLMHAIESAEP
jgi:selenocysteine lyase/cysteine desulfurase